MLDPNIPLGGRADVSQNPEDYAKAGVEAQQNIQQHIATMSEREKSRLQSTVLAAAQLNPYLEANDLQGAQNFLLQRRAELTKRAGFGENIDTTETDYALKQLQEDPEALKTLTKQAIGLGQTTGILKTPEQLRGVQPAALQLTNAYQDAVNSGDNKRANSILMFSKSLEKNTQLDNNGNVTPIPGAPDAKRQLKYGETFGGEQAKIDTAAELERQKTKGQPLPAKIAENQDNLIEEIAIGKGIETDLGGFIGKIDSGELNLNVVGNIASKLKNGTSLSDEESRNLSSFKSYLEKLRNDSLRLNKGVQTEDDAVRAFNEMFDNINDPKLVRQRLEEIQGINARAVKVKDLRLQLQRAEYSKPKLDIQSQLPQDTPYEAKIPTGGNIGTNLSTKDPRVEKALGLGYTQKEIQDYLAGNK